MADDVLSPALMEAHALAIQLVSVVTSRAGPDTPEQTRIAVMAGGMAFATFATAAGLSREVAHRILEDAMEVCERSAWAHDAKREGAH